MIELIKYNKSGFTLIEITIALLILTVGLVGILTLFPVGFDAAGRAGNITIATFLAQKRIVELKLVGYDTGVVHDALPIIDGGSGTQNGTFAPDYPNYTWEADTVQEGADYQEIIVRVYWPVGANEQNIELRTYIADYGS